MSFQPWLSRNPFGDVPSDFGKQRFDFIDETADGGLDKSLHPGMLWGPWYFNFNHTPTTPVGNALVTGTISNGNVAVFNCVAHGLSNGDAVRLETNGALPTGFVTNTYYYVVLATPDTFKLSDTQGGTAFPYIDSGTGDLIVFKRGDPYDFTDWSVNAWVKQSTSDADVDKILDLQPAFSTVPGQVVMVSDGTLTSNLVDAKAYWDMVLITPESYHLNVFVANRFDITKTVTHPF
jgi:hypothetical protein